MQRDFDEIGVALKPGSDAVYGFFSGSVVIEYDEDAHEPYVSEIYLFPQSGREPVARLIHQANDSKWPTLFDNLARQLLRAFEDDDDFQVMVRRAEQAELGYGPTMKERL